MIINSWLSYKFKRVELRQRYINVLIVLFSLNVCALVQAVPQNTINNKAQIDTPDELKVAENEPYDLSSDDLAKELNNPNAPLAKLTIEFTNTAFEGIIPSANSKSANIILFKPVFPFPLTNDGTQNLFIRPVLAYAIEQPIFDLDSGRLKSESGFADLGFDVALGKSYDSGLILIGGIQGTLPIGADSLSGEQYRFGPEFIVANINANRVLAAFPAHQWDVSGDGPSYSTTTLELFALKFLSGGWTVGTQPKMSYDWETNQATIPLNLTVRKVVKLANIPMQLTVGFDYFVEKSDDFGPDYGLKLSITPVVPNFIYGWLQ
jgi:hypothetical protein